MIRRDYILRMIEEFMQLLARISSLKTGQQWNEAFASLDQGLERLLGCSATGLARLTDTELLARLIKGEPTQAVRDKALIVSTLLKEAGDIAIQQNRLDDGHLFYLKGLLLLLDPVAWDDSLERPDYVPRVASFLGALQDRPLPRETLVRLMRHFERTGELAKAEDCLFALLDAGTSGPELVKFGEAFYERLKNHTDAQLLEGNLPRAELESGLDEFRQKTALLAIGSP